MMRLLLSLIYFLLLAGLVPAASGPSGQTVVRPKKVLFLGNSITLHAPAPEIGWTGHWGMAATAQEKDYVHLLIAEMTACWGVKPEALVRNLADFERGFQTFDVTEGLKAEQAFGAEIMVLALGENVPELSTPALQESFAAAFAKLVTGLKGQGNPIIFVRSCFWPNPVKDRLLQQACADAGATFVDISALGQDEANQAKSERTIAHAGVAGHPGDRRMKAIASALWQALRQHPRFPQAAMHVLLRGEAVTELAPHGLGNVYAPEVQRDGDRWLMWYGGQGKDGHDRIHLADSTDGKTWRKRGVVLDCGSANHVNDPSVVKVNGFWWMFYTVAATAEQDEIAAATSTDGITWEKRGVVLPCGPGAACDSAKVGRPAVLHEGGKFRLWYDGQATPAAAVASASAALVQREGRAVGYAESSDGVAWQRHAAPVFHEGSGAIHVSRQGNRLIMVIESRQGIRWTQSADGMRWKPSQLLLPLTGGETDRFGQVTPFLQTQGNASVLYFGAAARQSWDGNAIGTAVVVLPPSK